MHPGIWQGTKLYVARGISGVLFNDFRFTGGSEYCDMHYTEG